MAIPVVESSALGPIRAQHPQLLRDATVAETFSTLVEAALERIKRCKFKALVLTVDSAGHPRLENSLRNGLTELATGDFWGTLGQLPDMRC